MKKYLLSKVNCRDIKKIQGEASTRAFFRILHQNKSMIAMVYPEENEKEISRIIRFTGLYKNHGLHVPTIIDSIDNRIILLEDLGDVLIQKSFSSPGTPHSKKELLDTIAGIIVKLKNIPPKNTAAVLDHARMKWEMDFFITHYTPHFCTAPGKFDSRESFLDSLKCSLHAMVEKINPIDTFAHRDFHSRNMLLHEGHIYLVDFQDSLKGPLYYDLVSFAFDAYLDLKSLRVFFRDNLKGRGLHIDEEQFLLTALQRNIKALGTFGFQVSVRKNLTYKKYIARTIRHIIANPMAEKFVDKEMFEKKK
ncbi:MAG: phosphotransferase [bacterium]|nr:phosphotransferase [bacterium]